MGSKAPPSPPPLQPNFVPALRRAAARNLGKYYGTWGIVPFVNRTFDWGAVVAPFLSFMTVVPRHCARLTNFLHPKWR